MDVSQRRRLVRARGLAAFRRALSALSVGGGPLAARRRLVVVPTRAAAELLRQTIEAGAAAEGVRTIVMPDFATRDEWLRRLHLALPGAPPLLSRVEREVILLRAAREALAVHGQAGLSLHLRPGLVSAMLAFYDELQRRQRTVRRFARGLFDELRVERGTDRGSESLIDQTRFLGFTFLAYTRGVAASGGLDEHALRSALIAMQPTLPFDELVVAVADHPADPQGLWPADFDLIGRLTRLADVHVVVTDEAHDAGLRDRLERELPGIEETRAADVAWSPVLTTPESQDGRRAFVSRDREEEVRDVARAIRERADREGEGPASVAIVFHRPLPYLYLAQQVLADARIPYQAFDALPLAAEPYAALLDLVLAMARTGGTREAALALLRSSLLAFAVDGRAVTREDVSTLETVLLERRVAGEAGGFGREVDAFFGDREWRHGLAAESARRASQAAARAASALAPYRTAPSGADQVSTLASFLRTHERPVGSNDERADRHRRARAAVLGVLEALADAFRQHDDHHREDGDLSAAIHHVVEAQTFMPRRGHAGVHLVDSVAARFGDFDDVYLVGLAETDWTNRRRRTIFYSTGLLKSLGWPQDSDQTLADEAAFRDCLTLARRRTRLSTFELDGDTIVGRSPMIELAYGMPSEPVAPATPRRLFADERLTLGVVPPGLDRRQAEWLRLRHERPPLSTPSYAGRVTPPSVDAYRVSAIDRYVACPFKYYAEHVLKLREELTDGSGLTPIERGTLLHTLFEQFYREWQRQGEHAITKVNLPRALEVFSSVVAACLAVLPEADRALEHMRLMGSIVGRGVAERVFEIEIAEGLEVRERLLEEALTGAFQFSRDDGTAATIGIRGKADRIDVLADGSIRVVDYKLGLMPDLDTSVQVAVYAHCARQVLEARDGEPRPIASAMYLAFGDDRRIEGRLESTSGSDGDVIESRVHAFARTIGRIEAGEFPARPLKPSDCQWCGFATVCRKEYAIGADEPADAL